MAVNPFLPFSFWRLSRPVRARAETDFGNALDIQAEDERIRAMCPAQLVCGITVGTSSGVFPITTFQVQRREDLEAGLDA